MEKQIKRTEIYDGKVIHVVCDDVELDDGTRSKREVVLHNGGACIALKKDGQYFMVSQYRYSIGKEMLEFCAGKLEKGEDPLLAVKREAEEELGYCAKNIKALGSIIPTCGYCSERIYLFYGEAGDYVGQRFDEDERLEPSLYSFQEIKEMIRNHTIDDAKTIALMYAIELEGLDG